MLYENLTQQIIGAAIEVHRHLGPGLLESTIEPRWPTSFICVISLSERR